MPSYREKSKTKGNIPKRAKFTTLSCVLILSIQAQWQVRITSTVDRIQAWKEEKSL